MNFMIRMKIKYEIKPFHARLAGCPALTKKLHQIFCWLFATSTFSDTYFHLPMQRTGVTSHSCLLDGCGGMRMSKEHLISPWNQAMRFCILRQTRLLLEFFEQMQNKKCDFYNFLKHQLTWSRVFGCTPTSQASVVILIDVAQNKFLSCKFCIKVIIVHLQQVRKIEMLNTLERLDLGHLESLFGVAFCFARYSQLFMARRQKTGSSIFSSAGLGLKAAI